MGGAILELEVDKILNRGIDIGKAEGAKRANMTQEEFARKVNDVSKS